MNRREKFKLYYESFKETYKDIYDENEIVDKVNWLLDKKESLPKSRRSVNVKYYDSIIRADEIEEFRGNLSKLNIELGHYNQSGDMQAAFNLSDIVVIINDPIILGIAANVITEMIKKIYKKVRGKEITIIKGGKVETQIISFEVEVNESKNKKSYFRIDGELTEKQIDKLIDKLPEISLVNTEKEPKKKIDLVKRYVPNEQKNDWEEFVLLEQLLEQAKLAKEKKN